MEVRTGKTLTSMGIAEALGCKNVLFVTKKKAISSIEDDYKLLEPSFSITVINYESLHKVESRPSNRFDFIVIDEAHSLGAFPKPSKRAKDIKALIEKNKRPSVCLMSGTPTPESYSQMFHQVYGIPNNPFNSYVNFYRFAKNYVDVKQRVINSLHINDYSNGLESIIYKMQPYTISFTQKEAGFVNQIEEEVLKVEMAPIVYTIAKVLKKDRVVEGTDNTILADTPAKMMQKLHHYGNR
jgi:SNF2 family DNA or RNA helicase